MKNKMSEIAATIVAVVALPLNIIGLAIPFWDYYDYKTYLFRSSGHSGLWQACESVNFRSACVEFGDYATDSLKAVRAMEILGMLILGLALLFGVIKLCKKSEQLAFFVAAGCLAIVAGCLMIIGCIIYATKTQEEFDPKDDRALHAGFGMCIVAGILSILAGVLYLPFRRRNMNSQPGQIVTGAQSGPVLYQVPFAGPGVAYTVGSPGTVISAPPAGGYDVTQDTGDTVKTLAFACM